MKKKQEIGITLIALVVTIVVLLILAGVSISLVLNNNGVISKAKNAKNQYAEAQTNEDKQLDETTDWIDETVSGIKKVKVENVIIPEGYYYVGGTKNSGIVISDNVLDKDLDKGKEDVRRDLAGNQWVWVPVDTPSDLYATVDEAIALDGTTGVTTKKYTKSTSIKGRHLPGENEHSESREPDLVLGRESEYSYDKYYYSTAGFNSMKEMAETMVSEYDEMIRSIEKYHGFYIGRYELSENGEKTGKTINRNWHSLYKSCKNFSVNSSVKTRMIWGLQWDATCIWIINNGFDENNSKNYGNYSNSDSDGAGSKQDTGYSENWKINNIYDLAGNCWEWTQEACSTDARIYRGGGYEDNFYNKSISRYYDTKRPMYSFEDNGTRPTLYLIP
jgi:type II secretory pathway pseudopilin PulG